MPKSDGMEEFVYLIGKISCFDFSYAVWIIFLGAATLQIIYYLIFYLPFLLSKKAGKEPSSYPPVSVIVCARNEERNLRRYLPRILEQDYPSFEVVVVNDGSEDNTEYVLKKFAARYPHLKVTFLRNDPKFPHGKKLAVTVGIKSASHEHLLLTDADCFPSSNQWLKKMVSGFTERKDIVLGYGAYMPFKGWLNKIIRFDTLWIALQYFSFALRGIPYMGVGRNLAYRKSLFFQHKGFASHSAIESGDDDLFVNQAATSGNTTIVVDPGASTVSRPKLSWKDWTYQKRRHLTSSSHYKIFHKLLLSCEPLSRILFYFSFVTLLFVPSYRIHALIGFGARELFFLITIILAQHTFNEKKLFFVAHVLDILMPFFYFYWLVMNKISPYKRWK